MRKLILAGSALITAIGSTAASAENIQKATFAGGCFWCMEKPFDHVEGVTETISGFANGSVENPTYKQVSAGGTGHTEALQVTYDADIVSYEDLLEVYWVNTDPLDGGGQFCDRGSTYRPAIFAHDADQKKLAEASKQKLVEEKNFQNPIVTPVETLTSFYPAEEYHQNYYQKNPVKYNFYRWNCGRDKRLQEVWGQDVERIELF